jgi:iduronate 2-sulfatase
MCCSQVFNASWIALEPEDNALAPLPDQQTAEHAVEVINKMAETPDEPWFVAVGFHKPHLPYTFPARFLDYYPRDQMKVPDNIRIPTNMPDIAWYDYGIELQFQDLRTYYHIGELNRTFPIEVVMELRRAYYAAISYTDHLFGLILDALEDSGMADNTIISWVGDHGYQLGEHAEWTKETNFEIATHAPMLIRVPGLTDNGMSTNQAVEFVDLFPTLVDLADLPYLPLCPEQSASVINCREGSSMVPLFYADFPGPWKKGVFSQMGRKQNGINYMGYSVLVNYIRYTEWVRFDAKPVYKPDWEDNIGVELYDHYIDPEENYNRAGEWQYAVMQQRLSDILHEGWRGALPDGDPNDPEDATWMPEPADLDIPEHDYGPVCTNPIF